MAPPTSVCGVHMSRLGWGQGEEWGGEAGVCMKASGQVHYHCRQCMLFHSSCHFSVSVMLQMCTHQECTFGAQICAGITRTYILFAMQFQCEHTFQGRLPCHGKDASTVDQHINAFVPLQQCFGKCVNAFGRLHIDGKNFHFRGTSFLAGFCYLPSQVPCHPKHIII